MNSANRRMGQSASQRGVMRSGDEVDDISSEGNLTGIQAVARLMLAFHGF